MAGAWAATYKETVKGLEDGFTQHPNIPSYPDFFLEISLMRCAFSIKRLQFLFLIPYSLGQYPVAMSKVVDATKSAFKGIKNGASKFTEFVVEGSRIVPSKSKDHKTPLRIDAGKYDHHHEVA